MKRHSEPAASPVRKRSIGRRLWDSRVSYAFCMPYMTLFFIFTVLPVLMSIVLSFTYFNMMQAPRLVWFDNYVRLFMTDDVFLIALRNTLILAVITGPVGYLLCFIFAWFINELSQRLRTLFTLCFYAPSISGNAYLIWTLLFSSDRYGMVNGFLMNLGMINKPIQWFQDTKYMMGLCIAVLLWMSIGTSFLVFVAGFQGIDRSLYEAGMMDGIRNRVMELWYITLPQMKPQLMFGAIMSITGAFGVGPTITGLVGFPSTDYAVHTLMHHLEDYGTQRFEMGYASAIAVFLFVLMFASNRVVGRMLRRLGT